MTGRVTFSAAGLDARSFVAAVDDTELRACPGLLALFAEHFGPDDDATLVVATADAGALASCFDELSASVGIDGDRLPDVMVLPGGALADATPELVRSAHAVLGRRPPGGAWDQVQLVGVADGCRLARLAAHHWRLAETRRLLPDRLALPAGYVSRSVPEYFDDARRFESDVVHQPDVYAAAAQLARRTGATHIIDVGCGAADKLLALADRFTLVGLDFGANLAHCRHRHPAHTWLDWNAEQDPLPTLPRSVLRSAVVVCADVIEHLADPTGLLVGLREWAPDAQAILLSTPDRERVRGPIDLGPPANAAHVREWTLAELVGLMSSAGLPPTFSGYTVNNDRDRAKRTSLAIVDRHRPIPSHRAPESFSVTAVIPVYNEADVIGQTVRRLVEDGVRVHVVDNGSTDDTADRVHAIGRPDMVTVQRFPQTGHRERYDWVDLLRNTEQIAAQVDDGWVIHHDADEIRQSPWPGVGLRDALWHVQRSGYDAIDHTVIDFCPTDDTFHPAADLAEHFDAFRFGTRPGHFLQIKAWRSRGETIDLAGDGGHNAAFPGRRVFPYKFLLRHYPIRTQAQGRRKTHDRREHSNTAERAAGWHAQYDGLPADHQFARPRSDLRPYAGFDREHLTERLLGVGILETPSTNRVSVGTGSP